MGSIKLSFNSAAYALMRGVAGFLFLWHGSQKLLGYPLPAHPGTPAFITYIGGPVELLGGLLVMVGLFTRPAAFLCSGQMAVAYWYAHAMKALFPLLNGGEMAALYCFVFLFISSQGGGIWSIDSAQGRG